MSAAENKAVFLSYASQDAEAARRICEALRGAGVVVWFDQNELVGGDAWDAKIRGQIAECALFVPVISANTQARHEGYFRLEWKLAAQRTHMMSGAKAFLVPVVIDDTRDSEAHVPADFRGVQWTKLALPEVDACASLAAHVRALLTSENSNDAKPARPAAFNTESGPAGRSGAWRSRNRLVFGAGAAAIVVGVLYWVWLSAKKPAGTPTANTAAKATAGPASAEARRLIDQVRALLQRPGGGLSKFETATILCDRALSLDPSDPEVLAIASQVDTETAITNNDRTQKRIDNARSKAARAVNLAPRSFEARLAQARFLIFLGGVLAPQAEPIMVELKAEDPRNSRVLEGLGFLRRRQGRNAEADVLSEEAISLGGFAAAGALNARGGGRVRRREFKAAEADFERSIALHPFTGNVGQMVFVRLCWHGDLVGAKLALAKMPVGEVTEDFAVSAAVRLYLWCREPETLLRFLATLPRDWITTLNGPKAALTGDAHAALGRSAAAQDDWRHALALVDKRLQETPNDRGLLEWKAYLEASLGGKPRAQATVRHLREIPEPSGALYYEKLQRWSSPEEIIDELETRVRSVGGELSGSSIARDHAITAADLRLNPAWDEVRTLPRFQALQAALDSDPKFSPTAGKAEQMK